MSDPGVTQGLLKFFWSRLVLPSNQESVEDAVKSSYEFLRCVFERGPRECVHYAETTGGGVGEKVQLMNLVSMKILRFRVIKYYQQEYNDREVWPPRPPYTSGCLRGSYSI